MRTLGNIVWLIFGGLEAALCYFFGSLALVCSIIGIPFAFPMFKIGLLSLWPFGAEITDTDKPTGCIRIPLNLIWIICGGLQAWLIHILFGSLLFISIIGIPFGKQHFKLAKISLVPFGKDVKTNL